MALNRSFRKYHRTIAIVSCLPILTTLLSGMFATLVGEWSLNIGLTRSMLLKFHTGEIFHLQGIYPILNGLGLLVLIATGISMSGIFKSKSRD